MATKQTCKALRTDGAPCRALAGKEDTDYCFMHSPARAQQATEARAAGGVARNKPAPAPPIGLRSIDAQLEAIEQTIDRVRGGKEHATIARLVLYGVSLARPLVELGALEERIKALESASGIKEH